jgi:hypothetical protein
VELVVQVGLQLPHRGGQAQFLIGKLLRRHHAVGERVGERFQLLDAVVYHLVLTVFIETSLYGPQGSPLYSLVCVSQLIANR